MTGVLGCGLLVIGGGGLGIGLIVRLNGRIKMVAQLIETLYQLERELTLHLTPLPDLFQMEGLPLGAYFVPCGCAISTGAPLQQCWEQLVMNLPQIGEEEWTLLRPLGQILGRFEGEVQGEALHRTAQGLELLERQLLERSGRLGRIYPTVGLTAGAFLAILLA